MWLLGWDQNIHFSCLALRDSWAVGAVKCQWENPSVFLYIENDWEVTDLEPLQSVRKTWTEVQLEEPIIGLQGKGFSSVRFLPGRVCEI